MLVLISCGELKIDCSLFCLFLLMVRDVLFFCNFFISLVFNFWFICSSLLMVRNFVVIYFGILYFFLLILLEFYFESILYISFIIFVFSVIFWEFVFLCRIKVRICNRVESRLFFVLLKIG